MPSYDTEKAKLTRYPFFIVKFELDNTISPGGAEYHCFGRSPLGQLFHSSMPKNGYDLTPARMAVGDGAGFGAMVKFISNDFDFGADGTYWGRLLAANPYYANRKVKLYTGFYDGFTFDWANFKERLFFIKRIQGPDSKGRVSIIAHDPTSSLNDKQSKTPTTPDAKLQSSISSSYTGTVNIDDNTGFEAAGGVADIDGEFVRYSSTFGLDSIVLSERSIYGAEAKAHSADAQVSPCFDFDARNVVDVLRDLIDKFTPIDTSIYINDADWNYQRDNFLIGANATGVYKAGTSIKEEIQNLCEQFRLSVWWHDEAQEIRLQAIGPLSAATKRININEHILDEGEDVIRDPTKAVTETIVYYGRKDHSKGAEDPNNYEHWYIDPNGSTAVDYDTDLIREVFAKNIPASGTSSANDLAAKINAQYKEGEIKYKFRLDIKDADLELGQIVEAYTPRIQGVDGKMVPTSFIVVEEDQINDTTFQYLAVKTGFSLGSNYRVIAPSSLAGVTYETATDEQRATYLFIAENTGLFSNGDDGHWIL